MRRSGTKAAQKHVAMGTKWLRSGLPRWRPLLAMAAAGCLIAQGFSQLTPAPAPLPHLSPRAQTPPKPTANTPITDRESEAFGRQLENRFAAGDKTLFTRSVDLEGMLSRLVNGSNAIAAEVPTRSADFRNQFDTAMNARWSKLQSLKFVRLKPMTNEHRLLLRWMPVSGCCGYLEPVLGRDSTGRLRIKDAFDYSSGENMSQTFGRVYLLPYASKQRNLLDRLFPDEPEAMKWYNQWGQMTLLNAQGRFKDVLALYARLPSGVQKQKSVLLNQIEAASHIDEKACVNALELWRRAYPNDPATDLRAMNAFMQRKYFAKALDAAERLDKAIGGDAYLDYTRAELLLKLGEPAKANEAADRAIESEPDLVEPYFLKLSCLVHDRQNAAAIALLDRLRAAASLPREDLAKIVEAEKGYARLIASQEYRNWRTGAAANIAATQPVSVPPNKPAGGKPAKPGLKLQAIFYNPARPGATIGGAFVMVGDGVQGNKVVSIDPRSVTLLRPDGLKVVLFLNN